MGAQMACHLEGSGTRIEHEATAGVDERRGQRPNALLDRCVEYALVGDGTLGHRLRLTGLAEQGAAIGAHRHSLAFQKGQIVANGDGRHLIVIGQIVDLYAAIGAQLLNDFFPPLAGTEHALFGCLHTLFCRSVVVSPPLSLFFVFHINAQRPLQSKLSLIAPSLVALLSPLLVFQYLSICDPVHDLNKLSFR